MGFGISKIIDAAADAIFKKALIEWKVENKEKTSVIGFAVEYVLGVEGSDHINPDVKKTEIHKFSSTITENVMEDGSIISEHIIQSPIKITLEFEETNSGFANKYTSAIAQAFGYKTTFDKLVNLWKEKTEVTITTEHARYENMVIENMPIIHKHPYRGSLQIMCDFKQLAKRKIFEKKETKDKGTDKSTQKTDDAGTMQTKTDNFDATNSTSEEFSAHLKEGE